MHGLEFVCTQCKLHSTEFTVYFVCACTRCTLYAHGVQLSFRGCTLHGKLSCFLIVIITYFQYYVLQ